MHIHQLRIDSFRNIASAALDAGRGVNWLFGPNGAGKTSVLEAIHVLGRGRSFRTGNAGALLRDGDPTLRIVAVAGDRPHRLGLERTGGDWTGRIDGQPCRRIAFARALPLVLIDPENHLLVEGGPAARRSFIDWGLFHVEPSYLDDWQRYRRLLRQRNAAVRQGGSAGVMDALEDPMAEAAARVDTHRSRYVAEVSARLEALESELGFELPALSLVYRPGAESAEAYARAWAANRERDREQGFTREGPHRADMVVRGGGRRAAPRLSRGQMKLSALLLKLAQMRIASVRGADPVLLLDDPVSELDARHLDRLLAWIDAQTHQSWVTAVAEPPSGAARMFHVEQGKITAVV